MSPDTNKKEPKSSKRYRLLEALAELAIRRPKTILAAAALVTLVAALFIPSVQIVTDRGALVDSDEPSQQRYAEVSELFGSLSMVIVVLEGPEREPLRQAADELAQRLEADDQVRSVFHKLDMSFFHQRALLYLTPEQLGCVEYALGPGGLGAQATGEGGVGLVGFINGVQSQFATATADAGVPDECSGVDPLVIMERLFSEMGRWAQDPDRDTLAVLDSGALTAGSPSPGQYGVDVEGYLVESDGEAAEPEPTSGDAGPAEAGADGGDAGLEAPAYPDRRPPRDHLSFLLIQPESSSGDEAVARALTTSVRQAAREVAERHGVTAGVTGMPAIVTDEMDAVHRDVKQTIVTAIIFVLLLFLATFRSIKATALVTLPLILGLLWAAGFAAAVYSFLTMVSVYFAAVLFGLGIAFGIHLLARFDEALRQGREPQEAVRQMMVGAGPGIITGGITTAAAFFAVGFVEFQGFAQLGVVAGAGVVAMLIASLTVMPVCLLLWRKVPLAAPKAQTWLGEMGDWLAQRAPIVVAVAVVLAVAGFWGGSRITFDYDFTKLLPEEAEALRYYHVLDERSEFSSDVVISIADSLEEAEQRRGQLEGLDTVARAEAVTKYLPGTVEEQRQRLERIEAIAEDAVGPITRVHEQAESALAPDHNLEASAVADALEGLGDTVEDSWFAAQQTGRDEAPQLLKLSKTLRASTRQIREADDEVADARLSALEREMFSGLEKGTGVLLEALRDPEPLTAANLPANIRERFVAEGSDGSPIYAVYAYPTGRVGNREFLERFYLEIRGVDEEITGFPVTHYYHGELARQAFFQAAAYAAIATLLLLAFDFRRFRDVIFAAIPLATGACLMLGTMALLGWHWNFVNVVALPLVFGAGVDFGVHLVHRFRQELDTAAALRTTGRPVILSAVTTLVGMGGLAFAQHRGAASLGWLLVLGIGFCLVAAVLVLPAAMGLWLRWFGAREKK